MINKEMWHHVIHGSPAMRKAICEREPLFFAAYYFTDYFKFKTPQFHLDYYKDCKDLSSGEIKEAMWCAFRFAAKSSIAKIAFALWLICYKKRSYIGWDSQDGDNAEAALFDITLALQTNKRLISDFGHLYYKKQAKDALSEAKMKRIKSFITENGVKVVTFSTQQPIRGQLQGHERLDCMIFDDFENNETKDSSVKTQAIINHINEYRSGMSAGSCALYLCNYISDSGSVAYLMETLKNNPITRVRFTPVKDKVGKIAWEEKFTLSDKEAHEFNKTLADPKLHKLSLESLRRSLSESVYETEMMLNPSKSGDLYFNREIIDTALLKVREPIEVVSDMKIWARYDPSHFYGMGADTAEGIGGDSNASVIIDFKHKPNLIVASFEDANLSNTVFGWALKRQGDIYGRPFLIPEINNTGYGTIAELQNAQYQNMYVREVKNKLTNKTQKEYGWRATVGTKSEVLGNFKKAFEDGDIEILDKGLLTEMRFFTKSELRITNRQKGATRHYDKLRAAALAWEARHHITDSNSERSKLFKVPGQDEPYRL